MSISKGPMGKQHHRIGCGEDRPHQNACEVHPFELAFSGFSGAGKTTLLEKLVPMLAPLRLGYLKSDAHRVAMDREGKDTFRLAQAGCDQVGIQSEGISAQIFREGSPLRDWKLRMSENDAVLLEGFRDTAIPKILVLDHAGKAFRAFEEGRFQSVQAIVYPDQAPLCDLPVFHRDDVESLAEFVKQFWASRIPKVRGLVLAGGQSRRMGSDKASLRYHGATQAAWALSLLSESGLDPVVSRAFGQEAPEGVSSQALLYDRFVDFGPLGGILTAMESDPQAAWLVVGCDLPFVNRSVLENLIGDRDPHQNATVYLDSEDCFPEPMLSLWEPKSRLRALEFLGLGHRCPRKVLINSRVKLLPSPGGRILFNANTPGDREEVLRTDAPFGKVN